MPAKYFSGYFVGFSVNRFLSNCLQEGQHPLTGQRAADFRLLANQ